MPEFHVHMSTGNAAFEEDRPAEIARLLRELADRVVDRGPGPTGILRLMDINGNRVGYATDSPLGSSIDPEHIV
jgi:hypothetical protein